MLSARDRFLRKMEFWEARANANLAGTREAANSLPGEEWRPIPGRAPYEASSLGRIRRDGKIMKPTTTDRGYLRVGLSNHRMVFVHVLVLEVFVGPKPPRAVARHVHDRTPSNCCAWNLAWGSQKENGQDRLRHGTSPLINLSGERFGALTAVSRHDRAGPRTGLAYWLCRCDCGGEHVVRSDVLRSGKSRRCLACAGVYRSVTPRKRTA